MPCVGGRQRTSPSLTDCQNRQAGESQHSTHKQVKKSHHFYEDWLNPPVCPHRVLPSPSEVPSPIPFFCTQALQFSSILLLLFKFSSREGKEVFKILPSTAVKHGKVHPAQAVWGQGDIQARSRHHGCLQPTPSMTRTKALSARPTCGLRRSPVHTATAPQPVLAGQFTSSIRAARNTLCYYL